MMGKVLMNISVDWEGEHLRNICDLDEVRKQIGRDIPITHFICPSYFLKYPKWKAKRIRHLIYEGDEVALHIHCWKKLIEAIPGINFRNEPDFYTPRNFIPVIQKKLLKKNNGRGVPLSAYSYEEIKKIVSFSTQLLKEYLPINPIKGFRAGGWMASDAVLKAISDLNFEYDASAVPPVLLSQGYSESKGYRGNYFDDFGKTNGVFTDFVINLWGHIQQKNNVFKNREILEKTNYKGIQALHQPFNIYNITEYPNNLGMSDYISFKKTLLPCLSKALALSDKRTAPVVLSTGFHQEGGYEYKTPIINFLNALTSKQQSQIEWLTLGRINQLYQGQQIQI